MNEAVPSMPMFPTRIRLTKDQAGDVAIGDKVSITVSGEVTGITAQKDYGPKGKETVTGYEVELSKSKVTGMSGERYKNPVDDRGV